MTSSPTHINPQDQSEPPYRQFDTMAVATLAENQSDLPSQESTKSYWHQHPSQKLLGYRSTANLPPTADVVVVGSGITGAFAARELVNGGKSVVMLEAREACWGATGRVSEIALVFRVHNV